MCLPPPPPPPPLPQSMHSAQLEEFNMKYEDCPVFDGLWKYCQIYTGASVGAAVKLNYQVPLQPSVVRAYCPQHECKRSLSREEQMK